MKKPRARPKVEQDLKALQDGIIKVAKANLERDGKLAPVLFIVTEQEGLIPVMIENWDRERFPTVAKALVDRFHGKSVMFLTESWVGVKALKPAELPKDYLPSEDPERTEAINLYWAERGGRMGVRLISFQRYPWRFTEMNVSIATLGVMFAEAFAHLWPEEAAGHA
ncbi:MAG: hypothetical protein ACLQVJ_14650 [Syntrophobacteraceae bacterium]